MSALPDLYREATLAGIKEVVEKQIEAVIAEEIAAAQKRVEARIREKTGQIAISVLSLYSIERFGADLRITVQNAFPKS